MKIGIACYPTFGGSGVVATELGLALAQRGHEVHVLSYSRPFRLEPLQENVFFHEVEVTTYPLFSYPPYDLALASKLLEVMERHGLDIVHAHYAIPHAVSAYLAREMLAGRSMKTIVTLHGTDITIVGNDASYFQVTKFAIERSDGVTAVSNYLEGATRQIFGVTCDIRVLPNFIDAERFAPGRTHLKRECLARPGEKIVTHVSNFRPVKRIPDVVQTFAAIHAKVPSRLVLVGEGPELGRALELAEQLGIADFVSSLGKRDATEEILAVSDLFLLPSERESFGLAALEAMSCAVPVIGARAGGLVEVVEDGVTGFLCELGDFEAMGRRGIEVLENPAHHRRLGDAGRERAVRLFDRQQIVTRYEDYYREILARR
ncbi:MAG: N-acetyl-alpha-D-glucosaminyl L-malate synthase BshA [Planctomycetes bacterium]|nr:N-acetyl-alpha-D-glucosaminyl L-malate synthase BshA [Planctomycetota bacterium]